jgi:hypothetical protein
MKCVITGHTQGIGKALYDNFIEKGWEVVGLSRSNGYDINKDFDKVVKAAEYCDLFINNAYRDQQQIYLVNALKRKVKKMVVCGSVSRLYPDLIKTDYVNDKQQLAEVCRLISISNDASLADVLHLDLSFIESTVVDMSVPTNFTSDNFITFDEIVSSVNYWLTNTKIRQIEFVWKLTPMVFEQLKRANPDTSPVEDLLRQVKSI